ncbi:uncharacterized protein [Clytia hemisphaerica]|uniref:Uncharacterized protein n=1 Tax=Clytia hemisphaerica TaxID=252671 RepID=A0A7M5WL19_9CNID|eukprot:TCONS_00030253-protein
MSVMFKSFLICYLFTISECIVHKEFCKNSPKLQQCQAILLDSKKLPTRDKCIPNKDCMLNDLIDDKYASCSIKPPSYDGSNRIDIYKRCQPLIRSFVEDPWGTRFVGTSIGEQQCEPDYYLKTIICGEQGTRCVCDTGKPADKDFSLPIDETNKCKCQWFIDYCGVKDICSKGSTCKAQPPDLIVCKGGNLNQCTADPSLCEDEGGYCVEMDDVNPAWSRSSAKRGNGFGCIDKKAFDRFSKRDHFCNFNKSDHAVMFKDKGFVKPGTSLDRCCYNYLICVNDKQFGGYMFKTRPCYCKINFRKCLLDRKRDVALWPDARELLNLVNDIEMCTMDDTGKCNPLRPSTCKVGDLISPAIAHCKINCRTGPLLPIEKRSCKIRFCSPALQDEKMRIVDDVNERKSSGCRPVKGLMVECGYENTRCVCDGQPTVRYFTDRCRCQFYPLSI